MFIYFTDDCHQRLWKVPSVSLVVSFVLYSSTKMSDKRSIYIFGHSFPARLSREAVTRHQSIESLLEVEACFNVHIEGHPGLTYNRIFSNPNHYFSGMKRSQNIDLLCVDMGTNDLCHPDSTPTVVVENTLKFLSSLPVYDIHPRKVVLLSVIQRSMITRRNQVSVQTFIHRVRRFNRSLNRALVQTWPSVRLHPQRRINYPKYLVDGCHLNAEGMKKYVGQIKDIILRYSSL